LHFTTIFYRDNKYKKIVLRDPVSLGPANGIGRIMNVLISYGPLIFTLAGTIGAAVFTPAFIAAHPMAFAWVNAGAQLLHAVLPSIFLGKES
jgi:hypothetical protein